MSDIKGKISFSIIKHYNSLDEATTLDGHKVFRQEKLLVPEYGTYILCAPYDTHFIYKDPSNKIGRWTFMCACGSPAGIVGYNVYKKDASDHGAMFVCLAHAQTGRHNDGVQ